MRTVYKYPVAFDRPTVMMPVGATVRCVGTQDGWNVVVWAEVDTDHDLMEPRQFYIFGTGHPIPDGLAYVGTVICNQGTLIWHVYTEPTG